MRSVGEWILGIGTLALSSVGLFVGLRIEEAQSLQNQTQLRQADVQIFSNHFRAIDNGISNMNGICTTGNIANAQIALTAVERLCANELSLREGSGYRSSLDSLILRIESSCAPGSRTAALLSNLRVRFDDTNCSNEFVEFQSGRDDKNPDSPVWFAVLASYTVGSGEKFAIDQMNSLKPIIDEFVGPEKTSFGLGLYRTRQSNHYAIALYPEISAADQRATARQLVELAKGQGWADDAFLQFGDSWSRCEYYATQADLRSCGDKQ